MNNEVNAQFLLVEVVDQHERRLRDLVGADPEQRIDRPDGIASEEITDRKFYKIALLLDDRDAKMLEALCQQPVEFVVVGAG